MKHQFTFTVSLTLTLSLSFSIRPPHPIQSTQGEMQIAARMGRKSVQSRGSAKYDGLTTSLGPFSLPNHGFTAVQANWVPGTEGWFKWSHIDSDVQGCLETPMT